VNARIRNQLDHRAELPRDGTTTVGHTSPSERDPSPRVHARRKTVMTPSNVKRILLMDDSELAIEVAKDALEQAGYAVSCALDFAQLETLLAESKPDLVLMDVEMPELFGDDVGMVLRAVRGVDAPIVLYSMLDEAELAVRARDADIDGYICKRAGVTALVDRVRSILGPAA
jgi:DNA-binding response OmpR family regulator